MTQKGMIAWTFEYDGYGGDPGSIEVRIHFNFTPGTPETGRYNGPPENYDPGSGHEVEFLYAQREIETEGKKTFQRIKTREWLEEWCRSFLASRDEADLIEGLPDGGDPDRDREDANERRMAIWDDREGE